MRWGLGGHRFRRVGSENSGLQWRQTSGWSDPAEQPWSRWCSGPELAQPQRPAGHRCSVVLRPRAPSVGSRGVPPEGTFEAVAGVRTVLR